MTGFVVLHYKALEESEHCIDSLLKMEGETQIVVVDNGSGDGSGQKLKMRYQEQGHVTVLLIPVNRGFAKGNNVGVRYLRQKFSCTCIVVLNNDTVIENPGFLHQIEREYVRSYFAVMGPMIVTPDGRCDSNPVDDRLLTKREINCLIWKRRIKLWMCYLHLQGLIHPAGSHGKKRAPFDPYQYYQDVQLHGACLIFSEQYFAHYEDAFDERTFLYFEEDILFRRLRKKDLLSVYNPNIRITHLEDRATNMAGSARKRSIFIFQNEIKSLKILKNMEEETRKRGQEIGKKQK